ncbi:MAG: helix-turn-helix domain-containing protein [Clostridia bacterium]|nr:helix-turn-helix domain-containing protein [Clostridia bacterium]
MNLSVFAERLSELIFERGLSATGFAKILGCGDATIVRYLGGNKMPSVDMLVRMADYFNCTTDFLMGTESEIYGKTFKPRPPFKEQLKFLCGKYGKTKYALQKATGISETAILNWQRGKTEPTVESIIKMAEFFGCSLDYTLGRES